MSISIIKYVSILLHACEAFLVNMGIVKLWKGCYNRAVEDLNVLGLAMTQLTKKKKIIIAVTVPIAVVLIVLGSVLISLAVFPYKKGDVEKAASIELPKNGVLRVLQLTDLHLTAIPWTKQDKQTVKWVKQAVKYARADVVAVTGDAVGSLNPFRMRDKALIELAEIFEEAQVYWMYTFGNHDGEWSQTTKAEVTQQNENQGKEELYNLLKGYKYSLMQKGDTDGVGNYVIDVVDGEGKVVFGLVNMDSQARNWDENGKKMSTYRGLTDNQKDWYEREISALQTRAGAPVKSALFMHVPLYEYTDAWLNGVHVGSFPVGNIEGKCYSPDKNFGFFQKMKELGSTDFVTVGHDHDFNWLIKYDGVYFSYGRVSGVNAWERRTPVGATVIDINVYADSIDARYKVSVIEPSFEYDEYAWW